MKDLTHICTVCPDYPRCNFNHEWVTAVSMEYCKTGNLFFENSNSTEIFVNLAFFMNIYKIITFLKQFSNKFCIYLYDLSSLSMINYEIYVSLYLLQLVDNLLNSTFGH